MSDKEICKEFLEKLLEIEKVEMPENQKTIDLLFQDYSWINPNPTIDNPFYTNINYNYVRLDNLLAVLIIKIAIEMIWCNRMLKRLYNG